jgi:hypothetical protein
MDDFDLKDIMARAVELVPDVRDYLSARSLLLLAVKAGSDLPSINAEYHDKITKALIDFLEGGNITSSRNAFKRAIVEAFGPAFDLGWVEGGGDLPTDSDANDWLNARVGAELGYVEMLYQQAKELRKEEGFDGFAWASARADGYTGTLREVYNQGKLRAMKDIMVTFEGEDGAKSCDTCQELKGKRHRISWFVKRNFVPPHGSGLDCAKGGHCQHALYNDKGEAVTE